MSSKCLSCVTCLSIAIFNAQLNADEPATVQASSLKVQMMQTDDGVRFAILGPKPDRPAPTLVTLANDAETSLGNVVYRRCGNQLVPHGFLCVSVDLPCHGEQRRPNEPEELTGWRTRIDAGENPMSDLRARLKKVLDYLVEQRLTDPEKIVACGTSRGGFSALYVAAAEPRIRAVAAYAPVTDLSVLREFHEMRETDLTRELILENQASALADKPVWIIIGDRDERVGTDHAIRFARALSAKSRAKNLPAKVELHVCPSEGHQSPAGGDEQSAAWILKQLEHR